MYVSVKKRRHGKLAKCFVRRDCALYLRGESETRHLERPAV
jgi:hypothetical protein